MLFSDKKRGQTVTFVLGNGSRESISYNISKRQEESWEHGAYGSHSFQELSGVWKCDKKKKRFLVLDAFRNAIKTKPKDKTEKYNSKNPNSVTVMIIIKDV